MYFFDDPKERAYLMTQDKDNPQMSRPNPGITRDMQQEFFNRRNVWVKAHNTKMAYGRYIDAYIADVVTVYTMPVFKDFGVVELHKSDETSYRVFNSKQHKIMVEYIKMLFTKPSYWDNL